MLENIEVIRLAGDMAVHASRRQSLAARNIANADTPGYRAADLSKFSEIYSEPQALRATRRMHLGAETSRQPVEMLDQAARVDPNGNSVSLEREMLRTVEIRQQHDTALSIYRSTLGVLRTSLGRSR